MFIRHRRLLWQLYPTYLVVILVTLLPMAWYAGNLVESLTYDRTVAELRAQAVLIADRLGSQIQSETPTILNRESRRLASISASRVTIIRPDGTVVGDSDRNPAQMDNHAGRPEVMESLDGNTGVSMRYSRTLGVEMVYVAVAVRAEGELVGIVRTSMPVAEISDLLARVYAEMVGVGFLIALLSALLSFLVVKKINSKVRTIQDGALRFAEGDLEHRLPSFQTVEIESLARSMNTMATELKERIDTILRQKNEIEAILANMVEGVIVVTPSREIVRINRSAARYLDVESTGNEKGRHILELVRNSSLLNFVQATLDSDQTHEEELLVFGPPERYLLAHGARLRDADGNPVGALIVLENVTMLKNIERMRYDFVTNASHELPTPATAIKGFVETLREGAIDDPEAARRFLDILAGQTDRLISLIQDLLNFSKIASESGPESLKLKPEPLRQLLEECVDECRVQAVETGVSLEVSCPENLIVPMDRGLMKQAVVRLVENGIQYCTAGGSVSVVAEDGEDRTLIKVIDTGVGIAKPYRERIFERFYKIETSRSRNKGGAGLGLAVVKHIVKLHRGDVQVESEIGQGSTFIVSVPNH